MENIFKRNLNSAVYDYENRMIIKYLLVFLLFLAGCTIPLTIRNIPQDIPKDIPIEKPVIKNIYIKDANEVIITAITREPLLNFNFSYSQAAYLWKDYQIHKQKYASFYNYLIDKNLFNLQNKYYKYWIFMIKEHFKILKKRKRIYIK